MGYDVQVWKRKSLLWSYDVITISPGTNIWLRTADRIKNYYNAPLQTSDSPLEQTKAIPGEKIPSSRCGIPSICKSVKSTHSVPLTTNPSLKSDCQSFASEAYHRRTHLPWPVPPILSKWQFWKMLPYWLILSELSLFQTWLRTEKKVALHLKKTWLLLLWCLQVGILDKPFYDPTCGSGTIPIEAALIGKNIAQVWIVRFAAEKWTFYLVSLR